MTNQSNSTQDTEERLSERCEKATAQYQRRLLSEAYRELFGGPDTIIINRWPGYISPRWDAFHKMLEAEAFLDAAMTLTPEGCWLQHLGWKLDGWACLVETNGPPSASFDVGRRAGIATPALALCAAALKAKATQ